MTINAVILGSTGYVGGELLRLVVGHPDMQLAAAVSGSQAGNAIAKVFPHLQSAWPDRSFCSMDSWADNIETGSSAAIFSAAPHGASATLVRQALALADTRGLEAHVVDSSADFRYAEAAMFEAIYDSAHAAPELLKHFFCAVPEHAGEKPASHAAHPGCFATAMLLSIVPLFASSLVSDNVYVSAVTGSTGSGRSPQSGTHHPERHSNLYAYKPFNHRHVPEVSALVNAACGITPVVNFVPHSGPFARGIYATTQAPLISGATTDDIRNIFAKYYAGSKFVKVVGGAPKLKDVVASNYAHIGIEVAADNVVVMCAIDNLVKGAAGGAMQWMNRLWSLPEHSGLTAPPPAWI